MHTRHAFSALLLVAAAQQASAVTFQTTDTVTYPGAPFVTSLNPAMGVITPTISYGISNSFNGSPIAGNFPGNLATGAGGPWNFYDDYVFTVGPSGSNIQSALVSFSTEFAGISNLQGRIIGVSGAFDPTANLGAPASGTLVDSWMNTSPVNGVNTVNLNGTAFGPGTYDLQIRGEVLGTPASGGYGGSITFTPVPLPAALPLLLGGLGLFGAVRGRRRVFAAA